MARPLRIEYDGAVYHVTSRGNERRSIYRDDEDRRMFLDILQKAITRYNWLCHAYCLMTNHYHLLIETPDGNLSNGMRQINGAYTQGFNRRHKRPGHLFQGRYKSILIQRETHLLEVCRYVVLNPVRAKITETPEEWRWSSYRSTAGIDRPQPYLTTDWILGQFAEKRRTAKKKYEEFVHAGTGKKEIWKDVKGQSLLGEEDFAEGLINYVKGYEDIKEIPKMQRYVSRPKLGEIFETEPGSNEDELNKKAKAAVEKYGYSMREIADHLGVHYSTVSRMVNARFKT
jgi:REP element-mobilizing transposase RayT